MVKFRDIVELNGNKLTKNFVTALNDEQRVALIESIFNFYRSHGLIYPDDTSEFEKDYKRLCSKTFDLKSDEIYNNSSLCTNVCKYFCAEKFYASTDVGGKTVEEVFHDDKSLKKVVANRLGLNWNNIPEYFEVSFRMLFQGFRSMRLITQMTIFKPEIAKFIYQKYSDEGDTVYDYSIGWGGRLLGAMSCNRKYIGVDPLTSYDVEKMANFFNFKNYQLIDGVSEEIFLGENTIDLAFSSPPYYNLEVYSKDERQAYNRGEDYFYNIYWAGTLENIYKMLKPGKYFILNVKNYPKMLKMAQEKFELKEEVRLRTVRSHLNKTAGTIKYESCYVMVKK